MNLSNDTFCDLNVNDDVHFALRNRQKRTSQQKRNGHNNVSSVFEANHRCDPVYDRDYCTDPGVDRFGDRDQGQRPGTGVFPTKTDRAGQERTEVFFPYLQIPHHENVYAARCSDAFVGKSRTVYHRSRARLAQDQLG